nr:MAG TPA: hypothetical protein [Caudoviricetes sp.]
MKVTSINYFNRVVDGAALAAYKQTAEYAEGVEKCQGDWAFAHYQDEVEAEFTTTVPTSEGSADIEIDYVIPSEYGITGYIRVNGAGIPVVRFKFSNAKLGAADRELTADEREWLSAIVDEFKLVDIEL